MLAPQDAPRGRTKAWTIVEYCIRIYRLTPYFWQHYYSCVALLARIALALGKIPAFSRDLKVSIHPSYVLSMRLQPNFLAFSVDPMVSQLFPVAHMKNPHVPQSNASAFPPYFFTTVSQTGFLSFAHSIRSSSFAMTSDFSLVLSKDGSGTYIVAKSTTVSHLLRALLTSRPKYLPSSGQK